MQEHTDKKKPFISKAGVVLICDVLAAFFFRGGCRKADRPCPAVFPRRIGAGHCGSGRHFFSRTHEHGKQSPGLSCARIPSA